MKFYYSNKIAAPGGSTLIHSDGCQNLPGILEREYLGMFPNGILASCSAIEKLKSAKVKVCKCCADKDSVSS
ncbi:hypothetical protein [Christiangramia salexigens]|uniref:Uncharacterized protein n=1 Tax=Christiangramia salexigens TaxID=1913577 RepID=A0A1L3J5A2_9FLAO|nr:hypothetical protein [Christiangramia salexigens]APG60329.1 hypothetical protein LPB144_07865 [Christiangramia salexigens]